jgi:hypothetical protein
MTADDQMDGAGERLSFVGRRLPPAFQLRLLAVAPGGERAYDEAEWRDALVVVERGEIELESATGDLQRFVRGDVLWLVGLPLRALRNKGHEIAVLAAVSRRLSGAGRRNSPSGDEFPEDPQFQA